MMFWSFERVPCVAVLASTDTRILEQHEQIERMDEPPLVA